MGTSLAILNLELGGSFEYLLGTCQFRTDISISCRAKVIGVSFGEVDPFSDDALIAYEKALLNAQKAGIHVRALLLCNPHNPLGMAPRITEETVGIIVHLT